MENKSKWIVCGKKNNSIEWSILGYIPPQANREDLLNVISNKYSAWAVYGIWVVDDRIVLKSSIAPSKEVISVAKIFKTNDFAKCYADIVDGMIFQKNNNENSNDKIRVLATREGFCMMASENKQPFTIHWKALLQNYSLIPKRL